MSNRIDIAIDIGSVAIKAAAFDEHGNIIYLYKYDIKGNLQDSITQLLVHLKNYLKSDNCDITAFTGTGAEKYAHLLGINIVNEVIASCLGTLKIVPSAKAILSIGGIRASFIRLITDKFSGEQTFKDAFHSSRCSSGSGVFIEQEANRYNLSLDQLVNLALESTHPPSIAGRCAVFAKTDIVHKHQNGVPLKDIAYAICHMISRNITGELISNKKYELPIVLIGGVAQNKAVQKSLIQILNLKSDSLIIPKEHNFINVIGAYVNNAKIYKQNKCTLPEALNKINQIEIIDKSSIKTLKPLQQNKKIKHNNPIQTPNNNYQEEYLLGIDIGSTSTNVVCVDLSGKVIDSYSVPTRGQPLQAVQKAFHKLPFLQMGLQPKAVGITGSGRKYIGNIIKADITVNEITAHAESGIIFYPEVDTIIDIGGQDSKFIKINDGQVTNFEMNKVCSAGTGSFLEETATLLGLNIRDEFAQEAFKAKTPVDFGDRCTVFMNLELTQRQNEGFSISDLAAGLSYSIVGNYMSRVVGRHKIGKNISFQGGVAGNNAIVVALEQILKQKISVHPYYETAGAIGAALFAGRKITGKSKFSGIQTIDSIELTTESFQCNKCSNVCSVNYTQPHNGHRLYSGGVCDRYDNSTTQYTVDNSNPFTIRNNLIEQYSKTDNNEIDNDTIGIPKSLHFTELLPFWTTFFNELGVKFILSQDTTREMLQKGSDISPSSSCLPLKIAYGHCLDLVNKGVTRLFIPSLRNLSFNTKEERLNHICPGAQAWPYTVASLLNKNIEILNPTLRMAIPHYFKSDIINIGKSFGVPIKKAVNASAKALKAQNNYYQKLMACGEQILNNPDEDKIYAVIFSRPYTFNDYQIASRLQPIFNELNIVALPFDMIASDSLNSENLEGMYWYYGKRYLQAIQTMKQKKNLVSIFISPYGCGTDSFMIHLMRDALGTRPSLELEIDQHCDFTGLQTRLEAFVYSLKNNKQYISNIPRPRTFTQFMLNGRKIMIPQMSDHAFACAAALKSFGHNAEVMPLTTEKSISEGKKLVTGGECLPCSMLVGDMMNILENSNAVNSPAFFLISGDGPCRLGQYPYLLRKILDEKGHEDVPIIDMSQDTSFYKRCDIISSKFKKIFWQGSVAIDLLYSRYRELRPFIKNKEYIDKTYQEELKRICDTISDNKKLPMQLSQSLKSLDKYNSENHKPKLTIAIIGENYVRCNSSANQQIENKLEALGAVVYTPMLTEWIFYTNWTARLHCLYEKQYKQYIKFYLINLYQKIYFQD